MKENFSRGLFSKNAHKQKRMTNGFTNDFTNGFTNRPVSDSKVE